MTETIKQLDDDPGSENISEEPSVAIESSEDSIATNQPEATPQKPWAFLPPHMDHPELI